MAMPASKPPLVVIAGPTASGKSALALALAEQIGGVIVNADSAQIYRDLPILSAAPTPRSARGPSIGCTACRMAPCPARRRTGRRWRGARSPTSTRSGRLPILVGGTGLYLRTLLDGIAPVPAIDPEVRARGARRAGRGESRAARASSIPKRRARLKPGDTARIARALEVVLSTGRTLGEWQEQREGGIGGEVELRPLILLPPRDWLYARCDERFARMIEQGAVEEVEALLARKLNPNLPVMRAIGVREIVGLSARRDARSTRRSPRASRRPAATPSANIPGSRTSRRPTGRAFRKRSTSTGLAKRWPCCSRTR